MRLSGRRSLSGSTRSTVFTNNTFPKITFESLCVVAKIAQMQLVIPPPSKISHLPNLFQEGIVFYMAEMATRINFASSSSPPPKRPISGVGRSLVLVFLQGRVSYEGPGRGALLTSTGRTRTRALTSRTVPITPLHRHDAMSSRRYAAVARCVSFETLIDSRRIGARDSKCVPSAGFPGRRIGKRSFRGAGTRPWHLSRASSPL